MSLEDTHLYVYIKLKPPSKLEVFVFIITIIILGIITYGYLLLFVSLLLYIAKRRPQWKFCKCLVIAWLISFFMYLLIITLYCLIFL